MENASKALILMAEVLIGVLLLTLMIYTFNRMGAFSAEIDSNISEETLHEFNVRFEVFNKRKDLTAQDVITLGNLAKDYNKTQEGEADKWKIQVIIESGVDSKYRNVHTLTEDLIYEFIKKYMIDSRFNFECTSVQYNNQTKKVNKVILKRGTQVVD